MKQNRREIPQHFKPARQRDENSSIFGIYQGSHNCAICPKEEQISCPPFISPLWFSNLQRFKKPENIEFYDKTKGAVDMLDQMCAVYTLLWATSRWTMAMFYDMVNIAAVNALVIYAHNMRKDQPEKKIKRKGFLLRNAHDLVTPFVTQRYKHQNSHIHVRNCLSFWRKHHAGPWSLRGDIKKARALSYLQQE